MKRYSFIVCVFASLLVSANRCFADDESDAKKILRKFEGSWKSKTVATAPDGQESTLEGSNTIRGRAEISCRFLPFKS